MIEREFMEGVAAELSAGRPVAMALVLATRGSMPRDAGARMALLKDGRWIGTVGGGRVEQMAQERLEGILAGTEGARLEWLTHEKTGMACGGDALVGTRLVSPDEAEVWRHLQTDAPVWLAEDWSDPDGVRPTVHDGQSDLGILASDVPAWDEGRMLYVEPFGPEPIAYVLGGGHVGQALVPVLAGVGFRVVVADDRPGIARRELFPAAERVLCCDFSHLCEHVSVTSRDYVAVMTHGHAFDIDALDQVLPARPAYVGCIGSRNKAAFARRALVERGHDQGLVDAICLPIGEAILAVTPAEIAVSIAAQMIRRRAELRPVRPHSASVAAEGK